ncbi:unnamed protein product [Trichogramma brassicae]|uniref:Uncharacterized protein n=1 Tax=Trichogramma brassicae TaxID=86971 RepID=A0A6H5ITG4_9HYME|nr:unnamed protein product [Trichogramma brassicae]
MYTMLREAVIGKFSRAANLASAWGVRFEARGGGVAALGSAASIRLRDVDARTAVILESSTCHKRIECIEKPVDLERAWYEETKFAATVRGITMIEEADSRLSLLDFVRLPVEEASGRVAHKDYFRFVCANELRCRLCRAGPGRPASRATARDHIAEIFARTGAGLLVGIDGRQAAGRLCCEPIVEKLTNEDSRNVCSAAGV